MFGRTTQIPVLAVLLIQIASLTVCFSFPQLLPISQEEEEHVGDYTAFDAHIKSSRRDQNFNVIKIRETPSTASNDLQLNTQIQTPTPPNVTSIADDGRDDGHDTTAGPICMFVAVVVIIVIVVVTAILISCCKKRYKLPRNTYPGPHQKKPSIDII